MSSTPPRQYPEPNAVIDSGRRQIQTLTRRFFRQLRQPKWIKLSSALYPDGRIHLHSSQIGGFSTGKLRDPSPKALMVLGHLNLSLYAALHGPLTYDGIGPVPPLPDSLRDIWAGLTPMVTADGDPIGPSELFEAITGALDLGLDTSREIPEHAEAAVSAALGRHLRLSLASLGRDFLSELPTLAATCPSMEALLMGRPVPGDTLVADLPTLATTLGCTDVDLWVVCVDAMPPATGDAQ